MKYFSAILSTLLFCGALCSARAQAPAKPEPPPASAEFVEVPPTPEEPLAKEFSLRRAAQSLDAGAINFAQERRCIQCHANLMYLVARPLLAPVAPMPPDMRKFAEWIVETRWPQAGIVYDKLPRSHPAFRCGADVKSATEPIIIGLGLAFSDAAAKGPLHPATRHALETIMARQCEDGGFNAVGDGVRDMLREFDQAVLAALAMTIAPNDFAKSKAARTTLDGIHRYLAAQAAHTPYQQGMMLWLARHQPAWISNEECKSATTALLKLQRDDGGWSLASLLGDGKTAGVHAKDAPSDGYGTGFALFALRQADVPAADPRLQRAVRWLKTNQRESGRWFTRSLVGRKANLISNSGTAWAVMALAACNEIKTP
jgi:squalene-hopene/tetraprenyl-beta-curcumene cyclase